MEVEVRLLINRLFPTGASLVKNKKLEPKKRRREKELWNRTEERREEKREKRHERRKVRKEEREETRELLCVCNREEKKREEERRRERRRERRGRLTHTFMPASENLKGRLALFSGVSRCCKMFKGGGQRH
jgi:ribosome-binding ATPase YchF (GTP1/OBG family)